MNSDNPIRPTDGTLSDRRAGFPDLGRSVALFKAADPGR